MTLKEFNSKWSYKLDEDKFGVSEVWEEPTPDADGRYESDCESYAIFIKRNIEGFADWNYWYCRLDGGGHCVLVSPDGSSVVDNNVQRVVTVDKYKKMFPVDGLRPLKWYELMWKFASTKVILWWLKLK